MITEKNVLGNGGKGKQRIEEGVQKIRMAIGALPES